MLKQTLSCAIICFYGSDLQNSKAVKTNEACIVTYKKYEDESIILVGFGQRAKRTWCIVSTRYHHSAVFSTSGVPVLGCSSKVRTIMIQVDHRFGLFFAPVCYCHDQEWQSQLVITERLPKVVRSKCKFELVVVLHLATYGMVFHSHSINRIEPNCT